jgi:hypothetical protein
VPFLIYLLLTCFFVVRVSCSAVSDEGDVYVSDSTLHRIFKLTRKAAMF